jgi:uncharacterized cupredoxin-like copper-binding protein
VLRRSRLPWRVRRGAAAALLASVATALIIAGCGDAGPEQTPAITPGTTAQPRLVTVIAREYGFTPDVVDLVPGETVTVRLVNAGVDVHEAVFGSIPVQDAWEVAEEAVADHPPGPTPVVSVRPDLAGVRVVVPSGQRVDLTWTVPLDAAVAPGGWLVGCHIPGHWEKGMVVPVRFVGPGGVPLATAPPLASAAPGS